jgi:hypothetical protein
LNTHQGKTEEKVLLTQIWLELTYIIVKNYFFMKLQ